MAPVDEAERKRFLESLRGDEEFRSAGVRNYMERTMTLVADGFTAVRGELGELRELRDRPAS